MRKLCVVGGVLPHLKSFVTSSSSSSSSSSLSSSTHQNVKQTTNLITTEKFKAVTILSIYRPYKQNAMNESLLIELASQLKHFEEDNSSSVAVINGIGGNFSAGYDIDELKQKSEHDINSVQSSLVFPFQRKTAKPLLCSISGQCKAIGFEIALMCDMRYAEDKSFFGFGNRQFGIPLMNNGPKRLANLIGMSKTMQFLLMDQQLNAVEANDLGIVDEVVADGTALGSAIKTAVYLSSLPQYALQHDLSLLNETRFNTETWPSLLNDIKLNISLNDELRKKSRVSKLNNMPEWELEEIEHEKKYALRIQQNKSSSNN